MSEPIIAEEILSVHERKVRPNIPLDIAKDLFAGSLGGIAQVLSGQPFDIVKVRMQNQSNTNPIYKVSKISVE